MYAGARQENESMKKPLMRIAFVQYGPNGKAYPMRCPRRDINVGDDVEILRPLQGGTNAYEDCRVVGIANERWSVKGEVVHLQSELEWGFDPLKCQFTCTIKQKSKKVVSLQEHRAKKDSYNE